MSLLHAWWSLVLVVLISTCWKGSYSLSCGVWMSSTSLTRKSVAIVGGGFAGLSVANRLSATAARITIYDVLPPGKASASSAAGGMLHPLTTRGVPLWRGVEGVDAALEQMRMVQRCAAQRNYQTSFFEEDVKVLRLIFKEADLQSWRKAALTNARDWLKELPLDQLPTHTQCHLKDWPDDKKPLGLMEIRSTQVLSSEYLEAMWESVQQQCPDSAWKEKVVDRQRLQYLLKEHDHVILAAGPFMPQLWSDRPEHEFFVKYVYGQNILYPNVMKTTREPITSVSLLSGEYIVPRHLPAVGHTLLCGATHVHIDAPSLNTVHELMTSTQNESQPIDPVLRNRIFHLCPALAKEYSCGDVAPDSCSDGQLPPVKIMAGIRLVTKRTDLGKLPIVGRHPLHRNLWALSGLGTRGLVYHALMAQYLCNAIAHDDESLIPKDLLPTAHYLR